MLSRSRAFVPVPGTAPGGFDEGPEESRGVRLLEVLRMPLHAETEVLPLALDALDHPVAGAGADPHPAARLRDGLVVAAVHRDFAAAADGLGEPGAGLDHDLVAAAADAQVVTRGLGEIQGQVVVE